MVRRLAWQQIPSTVVSDILCQNKLDGVVIDTEHGCFNNETLYSCIQIVTANNKQCFVRLGNLDLHMVKYCLDAGATGLIFSTVETRKQAEQIHEYCKYPVAYGKEGYATSSRRGLGLVRQNKWGNNKALIAKPPIIVAQIETRRGVENIGDIKGFDFYMIGPYDLSTSLGIPGQFNNSLYLEAVEKVKNMVSIKKMAVHIPKDVKKEIKKYDDYGIIAVGMDTTALIESYRSMQNA